VNLAATVPGWTRWSVAEEMLRRMRAKEVEVDPQELRGEFSAFLKNKDPALGNLTPQQWNAIFLEFLQWQKQRNISHR
jgi:hypothetical protein